LYTWIHLAIVESVNVEASDIKAANVKSTDAESENVEPANDESFMCPVQYCTCILLVW
jgi:hypothetical protein